MTVTKITSPISELQLINKTNEIIDEKQDVLTAGSGITIAQLEEDTRSTATIVTVGSIRWQGVAYGNGVFVAVGNDGYVAYSSDGATWSTPVQVGTDSWYSITFANGKFVAVGNTGYTTTTTDGQTWTTPFQVSGLSQRLQQVRYGNGVFCAVGWDNKSTTSTDGITWATPVNIGSNFNRITTILFDGDNFVCFSGTQDYYATSTDGVTWTTNTINKDMSKHSSAFGNSVYVVGSEVSGQVMYSSDLTTWSTPIGILDRVESIYYDGTQFIAGGRRQITSSTYKYSTVTSTDGINWTTPVDIGEAGSSSVITYGFLSITSNGNGKFVAVGDAGGTTTFEIKYNTLISANIDDTLSSTSENPVQNKVITGALNNKASVTFVDWTV